MILKRFFDPKLAQTSYLIGCASKGTALVIDANRDIDQYLQAAKSEGVAITHVTETHIHADFVSGSTELAQRTGAALYLSDEGTEGWKYEFVNECNAVLLKDGDQFQVGNITVDAVHTPGHTPEHLSFLVTDTAAASKPIGMITGDFVFVGDVGRPDLLEKAAGIEGTKDAAARALFQSLQKFREYPDWLQIWPGHGAGSACGKGLSAVPHSTVGYERRFNWAFGMTNEDEFVTLVLAGQPDPPRYFAEMKRVNKAGPSIPGDIRKVPRIPPAHLADITSTGALVIDVRPAAVYAAGHVPGTINIPLDRRFTTWAGWLIPYDRDLYLIVDDECADCLLEATRDLAMIGLDRIAGFFGSDVLGSWREDQGRLAVVPHIDITTLSERIRRGEVNVLDVRDQAEWQSGHLADVSNIPLGQLAVRLDEVPRDKPLVVHCQSGARSAIAVSLLAACGIPEVINLTGGFAAWKSAAMGWSRE